ncbi:MAG TPA: peroxidase family protein [Caulobacteraceae bacterium]|jgi:hypothetical protein
MAASFPDRMLGLMARANSAVAVWFKWPFPIAVLTLAGLRVNMRWGNLFSTETAPPKLAPPDVDVTQGRMADGSFNGLDLPWMGMAGARFGRNLPINETFGETGERLMTPNPREVSNRLLARTEFAAVPYLNVMVSAWLQFMVHDWVSHGVNEPTEPYEVPVGPDDDWPGQKPLTILRSRQAPTTPADEGRPAAYVNTETHWWDGSQIYGSSLKRQHKIRKDRVNGGLMADGKIFLVNGHLPIEPMKHEDDDAEGAKFPNLELAGVNGNWWLGVSMMTTLFAREHNAVVDRLKLDYPQADGEWLFQKARLVVTALIAKIHTTEWTPALMNSAEGRFAMRANWWGIAGEHFARGYGRLDASEEDAGIPGSPAEQDSAPYAMTEEFTACYRMHPLMPDTFSLRRHTDDVEVMSKTLIEVAHSGPPAIYAAVGFDDVVYSLATSNPGALALHNYPNTLRALPEKDGIYTDLAAVDILRDRERGVPRYCEFRRLIGMKAPKSFDELTTNAAWRADVKALYADIEDVDLLVGTLCESQANPGTPPGFGFSDTVFRIFILMASRRLKSDRFYTNDFTPDVYTPAGFAWVADNNLRTVLQRHCPSLAPLFAGVRNVFFPWNRGAT